MPRFTRQPHHTDRARRLRKMPTEAERRLWRHLRNDRLGVAFRRQHPFRGYVLDFYSPAAKLAVEIDGGQHALRSEEDARRTKALAAQGITAVRFWNNEVLANPEGVLAAIGAVLAEIGRRNPGLPLSFAGGEGAGPDIPLDALDVVFGEPA